MNLSTPSRRETTAESEIPIVRPRFFGCEMRAKMIPIVTASISMPSSD